MFRAALLVIICVFVAVAHSLAADCAAHTPPLTNIVRETLEIYFTGGKQRGWALQKYLSGLPVDSRFDQPAGVFVTLSRDGKSRACWGSVFPEQSNVVKSTVYATLAAITRDYRY